MTSSATNTRSSSSSTEACHRGMAWRAEHVERDPPVWFTRLHAFANAHIGALLDRQTAPRIALVGKSMGALAAP